ncbi:MAG: HPr(Ser) kinase/phosphatase [Elusimicrobia bacterium]|nr:HPr(Ser) kinase/phosphatase [Elusimicrobiota bacterium]
MEKTITVRELLKKKGKILGLKVICGKDSLDRKISVSELNRPGLAIAGYLEKFRSERIQIIGKGEYSYCSSETPAKIKKNLSGMLAFPDIPCVIVTGGVKSSKVLIEICKKFKLPLLETNLETSVFIRDLTIFLDDNLAPMTTLHGVLVNVYGLGVLIQGDPGIGKSECAIELLKRGHILISDDIVEVKRRMGQILIGRSPETIKKFMEVRGIGIIDVELLFGIGAIMDQSVIEMQVYLQSAANMDMSKYDRTGLEENQVTILGTQVPSLKIPVTPGRNLAVLIEIASLNQRLKNQGYFAVKKLNEEILKRMKAK